MFIPGHGMSWEQIPFSGEAARVVPLLLSIGHGSHGESDHEREYERYTPWRGETMALETDEGVRLATNKKRESDRAR